MGLAKKGRSPSEVHGPRGHPIPTPLSQCSYDQMQLCLLDSQPPAVCMAVTARKRPDGCSPLGSLIQLSTHPQAFC